MQYLYKLLFVFMVMSGCTGAPEEETLETDPVGVTTVALTTSECNALVTGVCGGALPIACVSSCLALASGPPGVLLCGFNCGITTLACADAVSQCWNQLTNSPSGETATGGGSGGTPATGCQEFNTTLDARLDGWFNTGIDTTGAMSVEINVSGVVVYAPAGATQGPNGEDQTGRIWWGGGWTDCASRTCQTGCGSFQFRAVMGKFGSGYPFVIGSHFEGASTNLGNLYLTLNDCDFSDNSGAFSVHVTVCR